MELNDTVSEIMSIFYALDEDSFYRGINRFFFFDFFTAIGRTLIPRYFRSIFDGGVNELYYNLKHPKESFHNTSITLDCDQCTMVTHHGKPIFTKVRFLWRTNYFIFLSGRRECIEISGEVLKLSL